MDENDHTNETTHAPPGNSMTAPSFSAPTLDVERYVPLTTNLDIEEMALHEFLETLWDMLVIVAEHDLDVDPIQILFAENTENSACSAPKLIDSSSEPEINKINASAAFKSVNAVLEES